MKKYIEDSYTSPSIEVNNDWFVTHISLMSDMMADYWEEPVEGVEYWNELFREFSFSHFIWEEENLKKLEELFEHWSDLDEEVLLPLEIKIDWEIVYEENDNEDEEEDYYDDEE